MKGREKRVMEINKTGREQRGAREVRGIMYGADKNTLPQSSETREVRGRRRRRRKTPKKSEAEGDEEKRK